MKGAINKFYIFTLQLLFATVIFGSCINTGKPNDKPKNGIVQVGKTEIDTALRLKYTSGVRCIFEDSKGNFWFGSHKEGVCLFDGKSFTYFIEEDGLSNNQVRTIHEDGEGNIWFGTASGVSMYDGKTIMDRSPDTDKASQNIWEKTDHDLWFNGGNNATGVYRYDGKELKYLALPVPKNNDANNLYVVTGFAKGKHNKIWIATYAGVFGYDCNSFTIINNESLGLKKETGQLHVRSVFEDSKGNLWIGNNGIGVLMVTDYATINFSVNMNLVPFNSPRNGSRSPARTLEHVFAIGEDSLGNIWFGDRDTGAWRYDGKSMTNYTIKDGLTTTHIWQIYKDTNGELWFAMGDGSVCQFDSKKFNRIL